MQIKRHGLRVTMLATAVVTIVGTGSAYADDTSGNIGIANGTQVTAPISAAADVCGNAVGVLGKALAAAGPGVEGAMVTEWFRDWAADGLFVGKRVLRR